MAVKKCSKFYIEAKKIHNKTSKKGAGLKIGGGLSVGGKCVKQKEAQV